MTEDREVIAGVIEPRSAENGRSGRDSAETGSRHRAVYRVRFDESNPAGLLRTSGLLRYAQDIAWMHSEALGFDRAWYRARGLAWLVRAAELEVVAAIPMGCALAVTTTVVGHHRIWARRRAELRTPDGTLAAWVHTDWVLIDGRGRLSGRLTRVPEVFGTTFPAPPFDEPIIRVELPATPSLAARRRFVVRPQELDPLDHVNNAVYLDWLEESLVAADGAVGVASNGEVRPTAVAGRSIESIPRRYRLEYAAAAEPAAELEAASWPAGAGWAHRLATVGGHELLRAIFEA